MTHHTQDDLCPKCQEMLEQAHPDISYWFHRIKEAFPTVHTDRVWCGQAEQDALVAAKKSLLKWPFSKHNFLTPQGQACSHAMDLFSLLDNGTAEFRLGFYVQIENWLEDQSAPLVWGGNWKSFPDSDHWELKESP